MRLILHILRFKFVSFFKTTFDYRFVSVVRGLGSLLVFGGFAVGAYYLSNNITRYVLEETRTGLYLFHRFLSMMMFVFFIAVNLGNIIVSYSTLFRSSEVYYLMTKPVPHTSLFVLKFFDNFLYSSTTLFLVAFSVLLGYGTYFGYPWYFFAGVMVFVVVPFMFLAACLAILILMAIMRVAGRFGFRLVMSGIFILYFVFIFLFFRFSNPIRLIEQVNRYYPNFDSYLSQLNPGFLSYLPSHWVSEFLFFVARGEVERGMSYAGVLLCVTTIVFSVCLLVASRFYYRSWLVSLDIQASASMPYDPKKLRWLDFRRASVLPAQWEVLLKKEYFAFLREPSQWIHMIVMVILTVLFVVSVGNLNLRLRVVEMQLLTYLVLHAFAGFLSASLALRFVFPFISLEGKAFWTIRSAPLKVEVVFFLKFLIGFVIVLSLALIVAVATNIPFTRFSPRRPILLGFGVFSAFFTSLAMVATHLGLGGYFANFEEKNPIRLASSQGATLTFLSTLVFLFFVVAIVLHPLTRYFESLFVFRPFDTWWIVVPGTVFGMVAAAATGVGISIGIRSLRRDL